MTDFFDDQYGSSDDTSSDDDLEVVIDHPSKESDSSEEDESDEAAVDDPVINSDEDAMDNLRIVVTPPPPHDEIQISDSEDREVHEQQNESAQDKSNELNNNDKNKQFPSWQGQRLYPPNQRKISKPSKVWKFGGLKKVDGKLDTSVAVCALCGKVSGYRGSPGNFQTHLKLVHKQEYENEENPGSSQLKITDFSSSTTSSCLKYKAVHPKQTNFRSELAKWIVKNIRPISIVEDDGFKRLIAIADPRLSIPVANTIAADIDKLYDVKKKETTEKFKQVAYFSCTTDAGSSVSGKSFIDVNVHWINDDFQGEKKILTVFKVDSKKAKDYRKVVDDVLDAHGIKEKTFVFTTDNEATMRATFKDKERNGCFSHIESKASQISLKSSDRVKKTRKKLKKIAKKSNKTAKLKSFIQQEQIQRHLTPKSLKQEVATRFTATHTMIRSFLNDPNERAGGDINEEKAKENIAAVNEALRRVLKRKDYEALKVDTTDIKVMFNLVPTLDILEEGIRLLGAHKYCTASSVLPFQANFFHILEFDPDDVIYLSQFKTALAEDLKVRCKSNLNMNLLAKASFFDKRFSKLTFLDKLEFNEGEEISKEELIEEIRVELKQVETKFNDKVAAEAGLEAGQEPPKKKSRFLSTLCDSDGEGVGEKEFDVESEMERYVRDKTIGSKDDPLQWWKVNQNLYPVMCVVAKKYLCVQATSTTAERAMSLLGNIVSKKRCQLSDEHVNRLSYLSDC